MTKNANIATILTAHPLPWKARDVVKRTDDGSTEVVAQPIEDANGKRVTGDMNEDVRIVMLAAVNERPQLLNVLTAATQALRSYQHGNSATELAKEVADACEKALNEASPPAEPPPAVWREEKGRHGPRYIFATPRGNYRVQQERAVGGLGWRCTFPDGRGITLDTADQAKAYAERGAAA